MTRRHLLAALALAATVAGVCPTERFELFSSAQAQGAVRAPDAAEVLRMVRYSQAANEQDFEGSIRRRRASLNAIPLKIVMSEKEVRFHFYTDNKSKNGENQRIILTLLNNRYKLDEIVLGKERAPLPAERFAESIRDTDITYEDLAMRFLYWPDPKHVGVERAKGGDAWRIRCTNPVAEGAYAVVDVWVSQESGALVKMNGFNTAGKLVKSFEVDEVQRHKGAWILRKMVVTTHPTKRGERPTLSYLEMEAPE